MKDPKGEFHKCQTCDLWHISNEETYVIKNVEWDIVDHIGLCLSIDFRRESSGFGGFFTDLKEIRKMLEDAGVRKVEDLVGKPCECYVDKNVGHFIRMWKT